MNNIKILNQLIRIPSNTGDTKVCHAIIKLAQSFLQSKKVKSKIIHLNKRSVIIWGETNLAKTKWLINSHLDVVPGSKDQYKAKLSGDRLFGRGSADTKSGCSIMLANSKRWNQIARTKHITFMLVTDEEIGGSSTKEILPRIPLLQGAIFLEPTGEKMIVQAKGIIQLKITATGKSSHGSRPWEGHSALEILTDGISSFRVNNSSPIKETRRTTINFAQIESGIAINQIPAEGTLWCDIRWNPTDDPTQIISNLQISFPDSLIEVIKLESPINCVANSELRQTFVESLKQNSINPISGFEHGSSDARHCTALSIPAIVFGPIGKNLHGDNEWVSIKSMNKTALVLNHWIANLKSKNSSDTITKGEKHDKHK